MGKWKIMKKQNKITMCRGVVYVNLETLLLTIKRDLEQHPSLGGGGVYTASDVRLVLLLLVACSLWWRLACCQTAGTLKLNWNKIIKKKQRVQAFSGGLVASCKVMSWRQLTVVSQEGFSGQDWGAFGLLFRGDAVGILAETSSALEQTRRWSLDTDLGLVKKK